MYSELLKAFKSNKNCSFYTDDECDKFIYGKIIALNEDEVAIQMLLLANDSVLVFSNV